MVASTYAVQVPDSMTTLITPPAPSSLWAGRQTLTAAEAQQVLAANPGPYQSAFALGLLLGLRKNEVLALRRSDYDPAAGTLTIRPGPDDGSGPGRPRVLPVTPELAPYLNARVAESRDLLFPSAAGGVRGPRAKLHERVRSAVKRAGLLVGYEQTCRRCAVRTQALTNAPGRCSRCGCALWIEPLPRPLTFLDLRATFARLADDVGIHSSVQRFAMGLRPRARDRDWSTDSAGLRGELGRLRLHPVP
jgi:integrase